jgi:hypothetical protein
VRPALIRSDLFASIILGKTPHVQEICRHGLEARGPRPLYPNRRTNLVWSGASDLEEHRE